MCAWALRSAAACRPRHQHHHQGRSRTGSGAKQAQTEQHQRSHHGSRAAQQHAWLTLLLRDGITSSSDGRKNRLGLAPLVFAVSRLLVLHRPQCDWQRQWPGIGAYLLNGPAGSCLQVERGLAARSYLTIWVAQRLCASCGPAR